MPGRAEPRRRFDRRWRSVAAALVLAVVATVPIIDPAQPAAAQDFDPIRGDGLSSLAIDAQVAQAAATGLDVDYRSVGSTIGRTNFLLGIADFAVSDLPFQVAPTDGTDPERPAPGGYAYIPVAATGIGFVYNLHVDGSPVTNLRLSGENITRIFTGAITSWDDPQLQADNPAVDLPDLPITPITRSDGAGMSLRFTEWMNDQHPDIWRPFCEAASTSFDRCATTRFPTGPGFIGQAGEAGVASYVSQSFGEGSIGYVSVPTALTQGLPVVKLLNNAGYFVEPTPESVSVSLLQAQFVDNPLDPTVHLTFDLTSVWNDSDPRSYALSTYSYMIVPAQVSGAFSEAKGRTLAAFAGQYLCSGQQVAASLGYAPLPLNLVQAGLAQAREIPGADLPNIDVQDCNNPTFSPTGENLIAQNAPFPQACDAVGLSQCPDGTGGLQIPTGVSATTVVDLAAVPDGPGTCTVSWSPPAVGVPAGGYEITVDPAVPGFPTTSADTSIAISGLEFGVLHTIAVAPLVDPPTVAAATSVGCAANDGKVLVMSVTVDRPVGALILTQRCGVNNALPAFGAIDAFPGFPVALPALGDNGAGPGTAPVDDAGVPDPSFPTYPNPTSPLYPTTCGVDLGEASFVTAGELAGEFFTAHGRLGEITVLDTRSTDAGWRIVAQASAFEMVGDSFSGDFLGWVPVVTEDSAASFTGAYEQQVLAGPVVLPGTGVVGNGGLGSEGAVLAEAAAGQGLGIARLDARLLLLIPVGTDQGTYRSTLGFTLI